MKLVAFILAFTATLTFMYLLYSIYQIWGHYG